jgi:hypothetical protein
VDKQGLTRSCCSLGLEGQLQATLLKGHKGDAGLLRVQGVQLRINHLTLPLSLTVLAGAPPRPKLLRSKPPLPPMGAMPIGAAPKPPPMGAVGAEAVGLLSMLRIESMPPPLLGAVL